MKLEELTCYCGQSVAIIGGTFDPIHYAHLLLGERVHEEYGVGLVIFVPNRLSPLKQPEVVSSAEDRYAMVELAVSDNAHFAGCDCELYRPGPSYSIQTIRAVRQLLPSPSEVVFVTGADAVLELPQWRQPEAIMSESHVVVGNRPGFDIDKATRALGEDWASRIDILEMPAMDISSTDVRQRVRQGKSIRYLTPPQVIDYIEREGLYKEAL